MVTMMASELGMRRRRYSTELKLSMQTMTRSASKAHTMPSLQFQPVVACEVANETASHAASLPLEMPALSQITCISACGLANSPEDENQHLLHAKMKLDQYRSSSPYMLSEKRRRTVPTHHVRSSEEYVRTTQIPRIELGLSIWVASSSPSGLSHVFIRFS